MDADFSLSDSTVAILGLGLMGGSLAMALRGRCGALVGSDPDEATLEQACRRRVVDRADRDPAAVLPGADMIILAAPVPAILNLLDALPRLMPEPCIVLDIGSAKRSIVAAMRGIPERFDPLGGHPLCGREKLSLSNADAALYQGASFFVTPLERTSAQARCAAEQVIHAIGATPVTATADDHDRLLAATSHVPFLLSSALALATPLESVPFAGPGFRSTSRLAGTPASMMLGVLEANRDNVLYALHGAQDELSRIEAALRAEDFATLHAILDQARGKYGALVQ